MFCEQYGSSSIGSLGNKEERGSLGRFRQDDLSSLEIFINESFTDFLFFRIEGIHLSDLGNKQWFKINSVII